MNKSVLLLAAPLSLLLVAASSPIASAQNVTNSVKIESNTGGNSVDIDGENTTVTTGNQTVDLKVSNQTSIKQSVTGTSQSDIQILVDSPEQSSVEIKTDAVNFKLEHKDGKSTLTETFGDGTVLSDEFTSGTDIKIKVKDGQIKIQPSGEEFILDHDGSYSYTKLPLDINKESGQIIIDLKGEAKKLTLLPKQATELIKQKALTEIDTPIQIKNQDGQITYQTSGTKHKKLLGIFKIKLARQVQITDQANPEVQIIDQTVTDKLLDSLSI